MSGGEIRSELGRAGVPPKYAAAEWEQCRAADPLREYTGKIRHHRDRGEGLLLLGPVGTGKSSSAALICAAAVHARLTVRWFYVPDLVPLLADRDTVAHNMRLCTQADLLVWDDFGVEGLRDWQIGLLDRVVEARYRRDRPMVRDFVERYPRLNIADEIRKWSAWMTEFEPRKGRKVRYRARLTTWVQRAATGDYGRSSGPRGGSAAQAASAHGDTSEALERW